MSGRIRSIKPEWLEDEAMLSCSAEARVISIGLLLLADDHGRGRGSVVYLSSRIFPFAESTRTLANGLAELVKIRFVELYRLDGQTYYAIRNWTKHQRVDRPGKPRVPGPLDEGVEKIRETPAKVPETLATDPDLDLDPDPDLDQDHDQRPGDRIGVSHSLTAPSAPVSKRKRDRVSPERQEKARAIKASYCAEYAAKYHKQPPWGAREWGQLYDLLGSWTPEDLLRLVPLFFVWRNDRAIRSGHQWGKGPDCFVLKAGELDADVQAPERRKTAAIAQDRQKQDDHNATTGDQAARVAAMVIAKHANRQDSRTVREAHDPARSLLAANQRQGALAVDGKAFAVHRPGVGQGSRRGDDAANDAYPWGPDPDDAGSDSESESAEGEGA